MSRHETIVGWSSKDDGMQIQKDRVRLGLNAVFLFRNLLDLVQLNIDQPE